MLTFVFKISAPLSGCNDIVNAPSWYAIFFISLQEPASLSNFTETYLAMQGWNKRIWLVKRSHMTRNIQSESLISAFRSKICFWHWLFASRIILWERLTAILFVRSVDAILLLVALVVAGDAIGLVELVRRTGELTGLAFRGSWNRKNKIDNK